MGELPRGYRIAYKSQLNMPWPGVELSTKEAACRICEDLCYCVAEPIVVLHFRTPVAVYEPREETQ